jgi:hypothetical protein
MLDLKFAEQIRQNKTARTSELFLKRSTVRPANLLFKAAKLLEMKESAKVPRGARRIGSLFNYSG